MDQDQHDGHLLIHTPPDLLVYRVRRWTKINTTAICSSSCPEMDQDQHDGHLLVIVSGDGPRSTRRPSARHRVLRFVAGEDQHIDSHLAFLLPEAGAATIDVKLDNKFNNKGSIAGSKAAAAANFRSSYGENRLEAQLQL
ncbi:Hypothetical predicted protein, partial [Paramuricea clavata]